MLNHALDKSTNKWEAIQSTNGALNISLPHQGGEEQVDAKYDSQLRTVKDWKWTRVDLATDSTTVYAGPCRIGKIYVDTAMSAHACPIKDGSDAFASLVASLAAGSVVDVFEGSRFTTSLVVDPDNAATGVILVQWREAEFSV